MNPKKGDDLDYIHPLIAAQRVFTCTQASGRHPQKEDGPYFRFITTLAFT